MSPRTILRSLVVALLSSTATLASRWHGTGAGALYSMTNDPSGNKILIHTIGLDGTVNYADAVSTGGTGLHGDTGDPPAVDALFSQDGIVVSGHHLFAVNAGSNTLSMFSINPANPLDIKLVGKPVSTYGEFPVSVSIHPKTGNACVLNGGKVNGVICYTVDPTHGMKPIFPFQSFGLNLTTPPVGPASTVTQVLFSPDGTTLRASVKGNPPASIGFIATWDVLPNGHISPSYVKTQVPLADGGYQFGMTYAVGSSEVLVVSDPGPGLGVAIYDFSKPQVRVKGFIIPGQVAACWVLYSKTTDSYWLSDFVTWNVYEIAVDEKTLNTTLLSTHTIADQNIPIDIAIAPVLGKDYLYVLTPQQTSWKVYSLQKNNGTRLIQNYDFGKAAKGVNITGVNVAGAAVYLI